MVRYKTGLKMSEKEVKVSLWKQYKEMRVGCLPGRKIK